MARVAGHRITTKKNITARIGRTAISAYKAEVDSIANSKSPSRAKC